MTDIIERLRARKWPDDYWMDQKLDSEAADEIKQLRGHKEEADRHIKTIAELRKHLIEREELRAEIEKLQFKIEHLQDELKDEHAEVERLKRAEIAWHLAEAEVERLKKMVDGTERRESEYLALIEKKHLLLQERNEEVARLRGENTKHVTEVARLHAERHTTKRMLEDILYKHDQHYGLGRGGLRTVKPEER